MIFLTLGCENDPDITQKEKSYVVISDSSPSQPTTVDDSPTYGHPMQNGFTTNGVIFQEVKDDPSGKRYVFGESSGVNEYGEETIFSGVTSVEHEPLSNDEIQELIRTGQRGYDRHYNSAPVISEGLQSRLSAASNDATFMVHINFTPPSTYKPLIYRMEESMALGEIRTVRDRDTVRQDLLQIQKQEVDQVSIPVQNFIENIGGEVVDRCKNIFCLDAVLTGDQINQLATFPTVSRINHTGTLHNNEFNGAVISAGTQMETSTTGANYVQFMDNETTAGYMGNKGYPDRIKVALLEHTSFRTGHPGFKDGNGNSRITLKRECDYFWEFNIYCMCWSYIQKCKTRSSFAYPTSSHGTWTAGILAGDITKGQDPDFPGTNTFEQRRRSGYARDAQIYLWRAVDDYLINNALDDIVNYDPHLLSMSIEYEGLDTTCTGEDSLSKDANDLYEAGIPLIYAAGNDFHLNTSTWDCKIDSPGSAMGVFVVGAHGNGSIDINNTYNQNDENEVRYGAIRNSSSRGGTTTEGKGRTIIDISGPACREYAFGIGANDLYDTRYWDEETQSYAFICGTSMAAPTVAAGAAQLMDFYKHKYNSDMEDPGKLYTNLLLMGDRHVFSSQTGQPYSDFDNVWGAGRFKMRRWDTYGLDDPSDFESKTTCIDDGDNVLFNINRDPVTENARPLPTGVDVIKAVITWYDHRHENGTAIDNINLTLEEFICPSWYCYWTSVGIYRPVSPTEEKERIFLSGNLSGRTFRLKITGADVTSDDAGCGTDSMRVHLAYFWEDSARDDAVGGGIGPNYDIDNEETIIN